MIDIFWGLSEEKLPELSSYIFGGIIGLMGIVAAILVFFIDSKLSQINAILDVSNEKYFNKELNYNDFKKIFATYTQQWNYASYDTWFKILLVTFFALSSAIVEVFLYFICCNAFGAKFTSRFIILNTPFIVFLIIVYELIFAPDTIIFNKWRPSKLIRKLYPYDEIARKYYGFLDLEDIEKLELNKFNKVKYAIIRLIDKIKKYKIKTSKDSKNS